MEQEKNNKGVIALLLVIIVILLALVVLLATGTISFKREVQNNNEQNNTNESTSFNDNTNVVDNNDNVQQITIAQLKGSYIDASDGNNAVFKIYTYNGKNVLYKAKAGANAFGEITQIKTISSNEVELTVLFNDKENLIGYDYKLNESSIIKLDISQINNGIIKELDSDNFTYTKKDCNASEDIYDNACQSLKNEKQ